MLLLCACAARAQEAPGGVFQRLFPAPTGRNGAEEFVRAGDLLKRCTEWQRIEQSPEPTLAEKRRVLQRPEIQQALTLLRGGLRKPFLSPHAALDEETELPELALYRSLARLLAVEMYVRLADGRTGQALESLADGLRFAYLIEGETLISGLVAIAMNSMLVRRLAPHLDQLSARDCERLVALAREWISLPDPAIRIADQERQAIRRILDKHRAQPARLLAVLWPDELERGDRSGASRLQAALSGPAAGAVLDGALARLDSYHAAVLECLRRPVWERTEPPRPADDGTAAWALFDGLAPDMGRIVDRFGAELAMVQLLGVHGAVRRYRWEHDRLPASLSELGLGRLAIDPFTGRELAYRKTGERSFELSSAGAVDRGSPDRPPSGQRVPVRL